jgi:hypothetical protein
VVSGEQPGVSFGGSSYPSLLPFLSHTHLLECFHIKMRNGAAKLCGHLEGMPLSCKKGQLQEEPWFLEEKVYSSSTVLGFSSVQQHFHLTVNFNSRFLPCCSWPAEVWPLAFQVSPCFLTHRDGCSCAERKPESRGGWGLTGLSLSLTLALSRLCGPHQSL